MKEEQGFLYFKKDKGGRDLLLYRDAEHREYIGSLFDAIPNIEELEPDSDGTKKIRIRNIRDSIIRFRD